MDSRSGLTLIELLLFAAIFMVVAVVFVGILVSITKIYARQSGVAEVNQQSHFLFQTIQRYIEQSSALHDDMPPGVATSSLKLYVGTTPDLAEIYVQGGRARLKRTNSDDPGGSPPEEELTTDAVDVSAISFTRRAQPGAHDTVSFAFTVAFNTTRPERKFSQVLASSVARVSAATFDSDLIPSGSRSIGNTVSSWQSINGAIYFDGFPGNLNVGVGISNPTEKLSINGALQLAPQTTSGNDCTGRAGTILYEPRPGNATDTVRVCIKNGNGDFRWSDIKF